MWSSPSAERTKKEREGGHEKKLTKKLEHLQKGKKPSFFPHSAIFSIVFFISFQMLFLNKTPAKNPKTVTSRIILKEIRALVTIK